MCTLTINSHNQVLFYFYYYYFLPFEKIMSNSNKRHFWHVTVEKAGVNNKMNDSWVPFSCLTFRVLLFSYILCFSYSNSNSMRCEKGLLAQKNVIFCPTSRHPWSLPASRGQCWTTVRLHSTAKGLQQWASLQTGGETCWMFSKQNWWHTSSSPADTHRDDL